MHGQRFAMIGRFMPRRVALALLVALAAPAAAPARVAPAHPSALATAIPFDTARVDVAADGQAAIVWNAPGVRRVRIFATPDAAGTGVLRAIGAGGGSGRLAVPPLPPAPRWYYRLVPDAGMPLVIAARDLGFADAPNLRDIGGYRTTDGRWVKAGLLYRSDQMNLLGDAEVARLRALGVTAVADLRTAGERMREPDRLPPGARAIVLDVSGSTGGAPAPDMAQVIRGIGAHGGARAVLIGANRHLVSAPSAVTAYRGLVDTVAGEQRGALVYHCTAGKDRTGWASAVLLLALGVPRETVMADYLLSGPQLAGKTTRMLAGMPGLTPAEQAEGRTLLGVEPAFLAAALDEVDKRYGSFDAYLRQGLGVAPVQLAALRARYLTGTPRR